MINTTFSIPQSDYQELISDRTTKIQTALASASQHIIDIGRWLVEIKLACGRKKYKEWLADTLGWASGIANKFIKLGKAFSKFPEESLQIITSNLPSATIYKIASSAISPKALDSCLEMAAQGEEVTPDTVDELIRLNRKERFTSGYTFKLKNPDLISKLQQMLERLGLSEEELLEQMLALREGAEEIPPEVDIDKVHEKVSPEVVIPLGLNFGDKIHWHEEGEGRVGTVVGTDTSGLTLLVPGGETISCNKYGSIELLNEEQIKQDFQSSDAAQYLPRSVMIAFGKQVKSNKAKLATTSDPEEIKKYNHNIRQAKDAISGTSRNNRIWYDKEAFENNCILRFVPDGIDFLADEQEEIDKIVSALRNADIWQDVEAATANISEAMKKASWSQLTPQERAHIKSLKNNQIFIDAKVTYDCPAHLVNLQPFKVTDIDWENKLATLDIINYPVEIKKLSLFTG